MPTINIETAKTTKKLSIRNSSIFVMSSLVLVHKIGFFRLNTKYLYLQLPFLLMGVFRIIYGSVFFSFYEKYLYEG